MTYPESVLNLNRAGISYEDAKALRRIAMTLHRWHEDECGHSDAYSSWCITRGHKGKRIFKRDPESQAPMWEGGEFTHDEDGTPFIERHYHTTHPGNSTTYHAIADKERGALKRLAEIMKLYPTLTAYVQGDPRGASLYILRPGDVPEGEAVDAYYSRGIAVYK